MTTRRSFLALGGAGAVAAVAGCTDFVTDDMNYEAMRAAPTDDALAATGFEEDDIQREDVEEVVDVGVERELNASFWVSTYTKATQIEGQRTDVAVFAAVSTPGVSVLGSEQNPIADMSTEELLEEFRNEVGGELGQLRDIRHQESYEVRSLGEDRTVDVFHATGDDHGEEMEVRLEVTTFAHEDDVLVLLGGHPREISPDQIELDQLMESVEHPVGE